MLGPICGRVEGGWVIKQISGGFQFYINEEQIKDRQMQQVLTHKEAPFDLLECIASAIVCLIMYNWYNVESTEI